MVPGYFVGKAGPKLQQNAHGAGEHGFLPVLEETYS
jgi:hypothetical protein